MALPSDEEVLAELAEIFRGYTWEKLGDLDELLDPEYCSVHDSYRVAPGADHCSATTGEPCDMEEAK